MRTSFVPVAVIRATARGMHGLLFFLVSVLVLILGAGWYALPVTNIVVVPQIEMRHVAAPVVVDFTIFEARVNQGILPGRLLGVGEDRAELTQAGYIILSTGALSYVVGGAEEQKLVRHMILQASGDGFVALPDQVQQVRSQAGLGASGQSLNYTITLDFAARRDFDVKQWQKELDGLSRNEAKAWLIKQPGVRDISVDYWPVFLANLKQKNTLNPVTTRFILDIQGKTSILE